jgi:hypothetical protein
VYFTKVAADSRSRPLLIGKLEHFLVGNEVFAHLYLSQNIYIYIYIYIRLCLLLTKHDRYSAVHTIHVSKSLGEKNMHQNPRKWHYSHGVDTFVFF